MFNSDCLFCKICGKKTAAFVIYEDERTMAFLDIMPRTPGHALVVPKVHAATIVDLPESEIQPLFSAVRKVVIMLSRSLASDGMTIGINQGEASGQIVGHLHVHVMPRFTGDGGGSAQSAVHNPPKEPPEAIASKILSAKP